MRRLISAGAVEMLGPIFGEINELVAVYHVLIAICSKIYFIILMIKENRQLHAWPISEIQSTLVISNSKGLTEILRDIRTSTYQSWESEENNKLNNHI